MKNFTILILFSVQSLFSQPYLLDTIQYVGHPENTYDLVILAEGYTQAEIPKFQADAKRVKDAFLTNDVYSTLVPKMNIFSIGTISKESGISLRISSPLPTDPIQTPKIKNTLFGIYFLNSFRAYFLDDTTVYKAKNLASEFIPFSDVVLILTNDDEHSSGRASFFGVALATKFKNDQSTWSNYLVNHEITHSIAGLADEYYDGKEISFNKDITNDPGKIRWKDLLHLPGVGIDSVGTGVYIPNKNCMMCYGDGSYTCPVCSRRIKEVVEGVSTNIAGPHRIILEKYDKDKKTITYTWDPSPQATNYEIIFRAFWRQGLIVKTTNTNTVTFDLTPEDIEAIPSWRILMQIRAFNATSSTRFFDYQTSIYATKTLSIPVASAILKISETSYRLTISSPDNAIKVNWIRLYNEDGVRSDILTYKNSIELNNLKKGKKYFYQLAAALPEESSEFFASPFSEIMPLNDITNSTIDESAKSLYTISPNPVSNQQLQIKLSNKLENETLYIQIIDIQGRLHKHFKTSWQSNLSLDIKELETGEYFAIIGTQSNRSSLKFIKLNN
ncbi:MAG: T9SS type A sorting domain-containing protein [Saprospiraceae bacterium]|nr:T9SS type A sorting domain-containing protein [Saprospiraceae bacterium]